MRIDVHQGMKRWWTLGIFAFAVAGALMCLRPTSSNSAFSFLGGRDPVDEISFPAGHPGREQTGWVPDQPAYRNSLYSFESDWKIVAQEAQAELAARGYEVDVVKSGDIFGGKDDHRRRVWLFRDTRAIPGQMEYRMVYAPGWITVEVESPLPSDRPAG